MYHFLGESNSILRSKDVCQSFKDSRDRRIINLDINGKSQGLRDSA